MAKKKEYTFFNWLGEITYSKSPISEIPEERWESFNVFMINRYLSTEPGYIQLVNYVQRLPQENKKQIYLIYKQMIPKKKVFFKNVPKRVKKPSTELTKHISKYFECGAGEAEEYIDILRDRGVTSILYQIGITDDKEIKKLLK